MPYFDGIEWVSGAHMPRCTAWVDKTFPDYYCLNYAHAGTLSWRINSGRFLTLRAPVAWWTFPGPWFQYGSRDGKPWDHYFVCFRGPRAAAFAAQGLFRLDLARPWVRIWDPTGFCREFETVIGLWGDIAALPQRRIHVLERLLLHLIEQRTIESKDPRNQSIRRLAVEIRSSPARAWDFAGEARRLRISLVHFHRLFRDVTRLPPRRFVIHSRLEAAARLLHSNDQPLKVIAEMVGYPDIYYFSRHFRRHFGVPPGRYRREAGLP